MAIPSTQSNRSESEMVSKLRPIMPVDLFMAAIQGNSAVLIPRLGLQPEEPMETQVTIEASHSAPEQIKTDYQTVQSELQSATRFGDTILHLLVTKRHNELALMVFRRDVSLLKSPNKKLETPLQCAAKVGNNNVIHNLIEIDSDAVKDARTKNENGDTALHVAATYGRIGVSLELMQLDPEVAYRVNNNMFSALNIAIDKKYTKMVQTMLEQDHALAYTQFSTGMFPVHLAASTVNDELVLHLMQKYPECAELLDPHGRNLFHVVAEEGMSKSFWEIFQSTSVREIIARMNNAMDYEGNTPLHIAAMKGNRFTMEAICENKMNHVADTIRNKEGLIPFELSRRQVLGTCKDDDTHKILQISEYVNTVGFEFTPRWFEDIMEPQSNDRWERTQVVGLGSVLITTVAFAAAFTIPGGYNQDHGTPVLGRRYIFRAFILADTMAFIQGSISLFALLMTAMNNEYHSAIPFAALSFMLALSSMIVAFGLGLYVTLAPVCYPIAVLILVISLFLGSPVGLLLIFLTQKKLIGRPGTPAFIYQIAVSFVVSFLIIFCLAFL